MHGGLQGVSAEDFAASWERFLEALWTAVNRRLEQTDYDSFRTEFRSLYVDTFDTLRSERLLSEMRLAAAAALEETGGLEGLGFILRELDAYVAWQERVAPSGATAGQIQAPTVPGGIPEPRPDAIRAGQTIKESLEDFLKIKISGRLGKFLKGLNELLSLAGVG